MSKQIIICCSRCGRDLYTFIPDSSNYRQGGKHIQHIDFYSIKENGKEEEQLCPLCYGKEKDGNDTLYGLLRMHLTAFWNEIEEWHNRKNSNLDYAQYEVLKEMFEKYFKQD